MSWFRTILEGDSLSRLKEYARKSPDPAASAIAQIGTNLILAGQSDRLAAEQMLHEAQMTQAATEEAIRDARQEGQAMVNRQERMLDAREDAIRLTAERRNREANPKPAVEISDFDLDTDDGVKSFLKSF